MNNTALADISRTTRHQLPWQAGKLIGQGASADVYAVIDQATGKESADCMKVICTNHLLSRKDRLLLSGKDALFCSKIHQFRFRQAKNELIMLRDLQDCPQIVALKDSRELEEQEDGSLTLALLMERLTPLKNAGAKTADAAFVAALGKDICRALIACQAKNIIHLDIKADNIFVSAEGTFKLADFGVACRKGQAGLSLASGGSVTSDGAMTSGGSMVTMAPEVYYGETPDFTADIYSLGMVMYILMNDGLDPFVETEEDQQDTDRRCEAFLKRMDAEVLPALSGCDEALAAVILKACANDPAERYQSAEEMLEALEG